MVKADYLYDAGPQLLMGALGIVISVAMLGGALALGWAHTLSGPSWGDALVYLWQTGWTIVAIIMPIGGIMMVLAGRGA